MSIIVPAEFESFVTARVAAGAYPSEGDVLRAAFNLLEQRESLLAHIDEGTNNLRSGRYAEYGPDDRDRFISDIEAAATRFNGAKESQ